jgi:hypothetical protein
MDVHLFTSKESADTLVRLNILFKRSRWTRIMWDGIIAFTHAGFAAGSDWRLGAALDSAAFFMFPSDCSLGPEPFRCSLNFGQPKPLRPCAPRKGINEQNASLKRYCHPSRELFRAGDLLFFRLITQ